MSIPLSAYLSCGHCGCEFLATDRQIKRSRSSDYSGRSYCSGICQRAAIPGRAKTTNYGGICPTCGAAFKSRYDGKIYCSLKCYTSSPKFREQLRLQSAKGNAARVLKLTGELPKPKIEIACLNCGTTKIVKASQSKGKFCNHRCYRQYMAARFDRWIASPQAIALPQSYDEFLTQEKLPCLIDGCTWVGEHLGNHVNFAHGIPAEDFKRAAGFNLKTGLVTPAVSETLSERPHIQENPFGGSSGWWSQSVVPPRPVRNYKSLEGSEHSAKARALMQAGDNLPPRTCHGCGKEYQPGPVAYTSKFCSVPCRDAWYETNRKNTRFWMRCAICMKDFQGLIEQKRRTERSKPVFCSIHCRQIHNGKAAGAAHRKRYMQKMASNAADGTICG